MTISIRLVIAFLSMLSFTVSAATPACFANWFCFTVDEDSQKVFVQRTRPHPVVVTLTSGVTNTPVTVDLTQDASVYVGTTSGIGHFWHTMRVLWTPGILNARHDDTVRYQFPLKPPEDYTIVQGFDGAFSHTGASRYAVDIAAAVGTPVYAARGGRVIDIKASSDSGGPEKSFADEANFIAILHADNTVGEYYHLKKNGVAVSLGDTVSTGDKIGFSGNTGFSTIPHLHFAVYRVTDQGRHQTIPFTFATSVRNLNK